MPFILVLPHTAYVVLLGRMCSGIREEVGVVPADVVNSQHGRGDCEGRKAIFAGKEDALYAIDLLQLRLMAWAFKIAKSSTGPRYDKVRVRGITNLLK